MVGPMVVAGVVTAATPLVPAIDVVVGVVVARVVPRVTTTTEPTGCQRIRVTHAATAPLV